MIEFILSEKIITAGILTGVFTTHLVGSFKNNILDPMVENIVPSHKLDFTESKSEKNKKINYLIFLRDLILWIFFVFIIYLLFKLFVKKNN